MAAASSPPGHRVPAEFPAPVRALATVSRALAVAEGVGLAASLLVLVALATFQLVARNLRLHGQAWMPEAPAWTDGVIRHSVFVLGFLGAGYATFTGRHFRIDALTRLLRPRARMAIRALVTTAALAICAAFTSGALGFLAVCREEAGEITNRAELFTSVRGAQVIVAGVALVAFHLAVQLLIDLTYVATGRAAPAVWVAEAGQDAGAEVPR